MCPEGTKFTFSSDILWSSPVRLEEPGKRTSLFLSLDWTKQRDRKEDLLHIPAALLESETQAARFPGFNINVFSMWGSEVAQPERR